MVFLIIAIVVAWFAYQWYVEKNLKPIPKANKTVFITGAASGLGKQLALQLLKQGCFVYAADLSLQSLEKAFESATNKANLKLVKLDVTKQSDIDEAVNAVKADGKQLFSVVTCAGISNPPGSNTISLSTVAEKDFEAEIRPIYEVNVFGTMKVVSAFFPLLLDTSRKGNFGEPCIALVSSVAGILSPPMLSPYSSGKHAVYSYADSMRRELIGTGVRVICFEPGFTATPLAQGVMGLPIDESKTIVTENLAVWKRKLEVAKRRTTFQSVDYVTNIMEKAMFHTPSRPHYVIDRPGLKAFYFLLSILPTQWVDFLTTLDAKF